MFFFFLPPSRLLKGRAILSPCTLCRGQGWQLIIGHLHEKIHNYTTVCTGSRLYWSPWEISFGWLLWWIRQLKVRPLGQRLRFSILLRDTWTELNIDFVPQRAFFNLSVLKPLLNLRCISSLWVGDVLIIQWAEWIVTISALIAISCLKLQIRLLS